MALALLPCVPPTAERPPRGHHPHRSPRLTRATIHVRRAFADIFHANLFMAQCGGIGVHELNKLEVELCEQLQWRLLPTVADMRELLDAMHSPQASFWDAWRNAPRGLPAAPPAVEGGEAAALGRESVTAPLARMPHAKSVHTSLARFFSTSGAASDGNLEALAAAATAKAAGAKAGAGGLPASGEAGTSNGGSPRSVMNVRNFSLSNLFGLASGW